ncbi:serine protease [Hahella sp. CCB-MM4]|uniref:NfeD family protein n=1 Tax=Hahella sp. (strain CCB-MM4) TaxID=1926491 RepID=UPI000B9B4851|nr:nodulation protein NfeD [Hahella sp. CCB-MM4]OZG72374.1 serine protease [Hahella sp. CCB-MM4]
MSRQSYSSIRHHRMILWGGVALLALLLLLWPVATHSDESSATSTDHRIWVMSVQGAIGPATADWMIRSLRQATESGSALLIVLLDTPGGLDKSMRDINQAVLASTIPVAIYVYPKGARAASAGTYMLYAAHIAAMAPATNLGAATPVQIGAPELPGQQPQKPDSSPEDSQDSEKSKDRGSTVPAPATTMERKQINDAVAYIRGLAGLRRRNADWAEQAVREAVSLDAEEALKQSIVDYIAQDVDDLIQQIDGKVLDLNGHPHTLQLTPYQLTRVQPDWRLKLLSVITDPSVAYILMLVGIYGLIFEFYNPGLGGPGIIGAICLLIALYALQLLPISYAGLGLILLGIALMIAEAFSPSIGILGVGGLVAFIVGSVMLMDTELPGFQIAFPMIAGMGVAFAGMLAMMLHMALRARRQQVVSGKEALIGSQAEALSDFSGMGRVRTHGEVWQAHSKMPVKKGDILTVSAVDGLVLEVEDKA